VSKKKVIIPQADSEAAFPIDTESFIGFNNNSRYALDPSELLIEMNT
jgi:hypothetical protein